MRFLVPVAMLVLMAMAGTALTAPCPLKHGQWEPFPALTDEFDGTKLDETRWWPCNPTWKGRQPGFFHPQNVRVEGGMLHLDAKKESLPDLPKGYHTYTTAAVKGKTKVRYGYFEIRARAMDSQASSAFWFYDATPEIWSEIDVFEIGARKHPHRYYMNTHLFHTLVETVHWAKSRTWEAPYNLSREFHRYGLEWDRDAIKFTIDGKAVREERNTHWHQPLTLNFDSETFPNWFGLPKDDALPATFSIDYVRAWKRKDGPPDDKIVACEFRFPGRIDGKESAYRLKTDGKGALLVRAVGGKERPGRLLIEYVDEAWFNAQKDQEISRKIGLRGRAGKTLHILIAWSKKLPWKREGRGGSGEQRPGLKASTSNGYHAVGVEVIPAVRKPRGTEEVYEFKTDGGKIVRVTVHH
jgi:beta-glucanase (GH16 family)